MSCNHQIPIVYFDLETSGLSPKTEDIIQIGAIKNDYAFEQIVFSHKNNIFRNIDPSMGIALSSALRLFEKFVGPNKAILVSHSGTSFDERFIKAAYQKIRKPMPPNFIFVDSASYCKNTLGCRKYSISFLADKLNIPFSTSRAHTALYDTKILKKICQKIGLEKNFQLAELTN